MNKRLVILRTVLLVCLLGVQTRQFAQDTSAGPAKSDQERHRVAIGLLRTINTAEVGELSKNGAYSTWSTLLAHQAKFFDGWIARFYLENPTGHFSDVPEILPGWSLRLNVHADGKGYDVRLQDLTDKTCWYAALTDESGVIRQSKVIDCNI
jgi:hypothetical protein